jgi:hypothetical protein
MLPEHIPEHTFNHIANATLRIGNADIEGHLRNAIELFPSIVTHKNVSYLWAIAMADYQVIPFLYQVNQVFQGVGGVLFLLIDGAHLISTQEGVSA